MYDDDFLYSHNLCASGVADTAGRNQVLVTVKVKIFTVS